MFLPIFILSERNNNNISVMEQIVQYFSSLRWQSILIFVS